MNTLAKIGLLLLMLLLVAGAFVLPKFVQRAEPPTAKEDLAAALAAVELEPAEEPVSAAEPPSPLREKKQFSTFFEALDSSDFEKATQELLALSKEQTVDAETVESLTIEMEKAVSALSAPPKSGTGVSVAQSAENAQSTVNEVGKPGSTGEPSLATPSEPIAATKQASRTENTPAKITTFDSTKAVEIMSLIQTGDFSTAESALAEIAKDAPAATLALLRTSLSSAKASKAELDRSREELSASRKQLTESKQLLTAMQDENVLKIQESVEEIKKATLSAQQAIEEASKLRSELRETKASNPSGPSTPASKPAPKQAPVTLPKKTSIAFAFDSTYLSEKSRGTLTSAAKLLKAEPRLTLQLRGHSDPAGASEYNAILAKARGETAKDFMIEQGISSARISVVAFGESQAQQSGTSAEEARRVDLIFRAE